jgi:ubiquinone/menaquinone biosynthesis C-methylase UbiE
MRAYERVAPFYDCLDGPYEYLWKGRLRRQVFAGVQGRILDAAIGTGKNMPFYPPGAEVVGLDISAGMLERARQRAARLGIEVTLLKRDIANTGLPDASFDAIVAAFVFCCVPEARKLVALRELRRLMTEDGKLFVLDYTTPSGPAQRAYMRLMTPWLKFMFSARYEGHLDIHFPSAGLRREETRKFFGGGVVLHLLRCG